MLFRQLFEPETSTFTYVLGDEAAGVAAVIDPVRERAHEVLAVVADAKLRLAFTLETHVHADHVTGGGILREATGARYGVHPAAGCGCADVPLEDGAELRVGGIAIRVIHTPGHTPCSVSLLVDRAMVLTGDALLVGTCGRTDFQGGDPGALYDAIHGRLFTLPDEVVVYPGHDYRGMTSSTIRREKRENGRAAGRTREAFIELMNGLGLPPPRRMAEAVPANLRCGHAA